MVYHTLDLDAINSCIFENIHHVNTIGNAYILINQSVGEIRIFPYAQISLQDRGLQRARFT